jgi:hypothetical protein
MRQERLIEFSGMPISNKLTSGSQLVPLGANISSKDTTCSMRAASSADLGQPRERGRGRVADPGDVARLCLGFAYVFEPMVRQLRTGLLQRVLEAGGPEHIGERGGPSGHAADRASSDTKALRRWHGVGVSQRNRDLLNSFDGGED